MSGTTDGGVTDGGVTDGGTNNGGSADDSTDENGTTDETASDDGLPDPDPSVPALPALSVGGVFSYGRYEQDNNTENGKEAIEWLVLAVENGRALVISKYALDCKQYNDSYAHVTWETSSLRTWLNAEFLNAAFTAAEQGRILTTTVINADSTAHGTDGGRDTQDKLFLLSISEVETYFAGADAMKTQPTAYALAQGADSYHNNCYWWLRTPGDKTQAVAYVNFAGVIHDYGRGVSNAKDAVRPAFWIDLTP